MIKAAIIGASGYAGGDLVRILHRHPEVEITCLTDRTNPGMKFSEVYPAFRERCDLELETAEPAEVAKRADVVFTAVPHKTAMALVPDLLDGGCKVVDLSADYRLHDAAVYETWYQEHTSPELLPEAVYGLPEVYREQIAKARLVANPGCYPTSAVLPLIPLMEKGLIQADSLIVDSKSGTTGAGRKAGTATLFCEVNEGFKAYGVGSHRHTPEIEQVLGEASGSAVQVNFTPHLLPINRGILSTIYAQPTKKVALAEVLALLNQSYADAPFVRVLPEGQLPNVAYVKGSNYCDIGAVVDPRTGRIILVSAIDNLMKGASGQAVQNMNLMYGFNETLGLDITPLAP